MTNQTSDPEIPISGNLTLDDVVLDIYANVPIVELDVDTAIAILSYTGGKYSQEVPAKKKRKKVAQHTINPFFTDETYVRPQEIGLRIIRDQLERKAGAGEQEDYRMFLDGVFVYLADCGRNPPEQRNSDSLQSYFGKFGIINLNERFAKFYRDVMRILQVTRDAGKKLLDEREEMINQEGIPIKEAVYAGSLFAIQHEYLTDLKCLITSWDDRPKADTAPQPRHYQNGESPQTNYRRRVRRLQRSGQPWTEDPVAFGAALLAYHVSKEKSTPKR